MSRLLLLFICLVWLAGTGKPAGKPLPPDGALLGSVAGGLLFWIMLVGLWCRLMARRVSARTFGRSIQRLSWVMLTSRILIVGAFGTAVFALGWPDFLSINLKFSWFEPARLPGLIFGTLPAFLAWAGLWWAHYPADRALRQQGLAENLVDGLPIHQPPALKAYLGSNVRLQILFTLAPLLMIVGLRDLAAITVLRPFGDPSASVNVDSAFSDATLSDPRAKRLEASREIADSVVWFLSASLVYIAAPELLRRILQTSPLPDSPLRRRLESLCRRSGMRYRNILVWHTHFNVGNAAVMGLVPRFRYILLSDLLLERMDDEQIEAVFAHEIGHVVHRHMAWYVVFFLILMLMALGPVTIAGSWLADRIALSDEIWTILSLTGSAGGFWLIFGFLSRRFERQADVYAARMMECVRPSDPARDAAVLSPLLGEGWKTSADDAEKPEGEPRLSPIESHVGTYGAQLFGSALHRVAVINNIPVSPRSRPSTGLLNHVSYLAGSLTDLAHDWLHGSIPSRMDYLRTISVDPHLTSRFDRLMSRLYGAMLFLLIAGLAYLAPALMR